MIRLFRREFRKLKRVVTHPAFLFLSLAGNLILFAASAAVYYLEAGVNPHVRGFLDVFWWAVSTITTVGFGDVVPVTTAGRTIGIVLMYTGTVLFISFTGVLVSVWTEAEVEKEIRPLEKEIEAEEKETAKVERLLEDIRQRLNRLEDRLEKRP
jgi:voltage-gated potassium channel